jgi:ferric-dicitrate binding protein FerR (iron transport regulator)
MSDRDPELDFTPEEHALHERVARAVRALPPEPPAAPYRTQMRARFVAGAVDAPSAVRAAQAAAAQARAPRRGFLGLRPIELGLALAGLAIVAALASSVMNAGPKWRVAPNALASGNVVVDDEPIPVTDVESLDEVLRPDSHVVWDGDGELMLHSPGGAVISILPGTEVQMPAPPPRWFARRTAGRVERGEIRVMTGPRFHGARFSITTPQAQVEITGTTLAVICEPAVTCVCVYEGAVEVRGLAPADAGAMVPAGQRRTLFADGRATEQAEMRPNERVALDRMRQRMHELLD